MVWNVGWERYVDNNTSQYGPTKMVTVYLCSHNFLALSTSWLKKVCPTLFGRRALLCRDAQDVCERSQSLSTHTLSLRAPVVDQVPSRYFCQNVRKHAEHFDDDSSH
jgi:hypothetical protein